MLFHVGYKGERGLKVAVLGSTGSIGTQTLEVVKAGEGIEVTALAAKSNIKLLEEQVRLFKPKYVCVYDREAANLFKEKIYDVKVKLLVGLEGLEEIASLPEVDILVTAVSGAIGLKPTIAAIKQGKTIALSNKETLVAAGELVMSMVKEYNATIIPVDSEHSAIFQCLHEGKASLDKIILTASGGPFRGWQKENLKTIKPEQALKHPNWDMGQKISIDSATLMNKGLEVIEAHWLFGVSYEQIDVIIHPQSIIHSAVSFIDGSILAHLGVADMRIPIQYAFSYPDRWEGLSKPLNLADLKELTFEKPDTENFPALRLAYEAGRIGGTMPIVLNAANEMAVEAFLNGKIGFLDIFKLVDTAMEKHYPIEHPDLEEILLVDNLTRQRTLKMLKTYGKVI